MAQRIWSARAPLAGLEGRQALQLGVASDLLVEYECTGRTEFDDAFIQRAKQGQRTAAEAIAGMKQANPMFPALNSLYQTMQAREKALHERFA